MIEEILGAPRIAYAASDSVMSMRPFPYSHVTNAYQGWGAFPDFAVEVASDIGYSSCNVSTDYSDDDPPMFRLIFPFPIDLKGILPIYTQGYVHQNGSLRQEYAHSMRLEYSLDSLSGDDGTWNDLTQTPHFAVPYSSVPESQLGVRVYPSKFLGQIDTRPYAFATRFLLPVSPGREVKDYVSVASRMHEDWNAPGVFPVSVHGVKGLRFTAGPATAPPGWSLYQTGQSRFWKLFLWGNLGDAYADQVRIESVTDPEQTLVAYHSSADRWVRIKNCSNRLTADKVTISAEDEIYQRPYRGMFLLSLDGENWEESLTLYSMTPGASSPIIHVRRVTGDTFPPGVGSVVLCARVGRWVSSAVT